MASVWTRKSRRTPSAPDLRIRNNNEPTTKVIPRCLHGNVGAQCLKSNFATVEAKDESLVSRELI